MSELLEHIQDFAANRMPKLSSCFHCFCYVHRTLKCSELMKIEEMARNELVALLLAINAVTIVGIEHEPSNMDRGADFLVKRKTIGAQP